MWNKMTPTRRRRFRGAADTVFTVYLLLLVVADVTEAWMASTGISNKRNQQPDRKSLMSRHFQSGRTGLTFRHFQQVEKSTMLLLPLSSVTLTSKVSSPFLATTALFMTSLPDGYQEFGTALIHKVATEQFDIPNDNVSIEWKPGRIIVTVRGELYLSNDDIDGVVEEGDAAFYIREEVENMDNDFEDDGSATEEEDIGEEEDDDETPVSSMGVDVAQLARAINLALDDGGVGWQIAVAHDIEVTTPGASNKLSGIMFESYKGFEVLTEFQDTKTQKVKTIEGRLVERNNEFTVINIKGRMKKFKNDMVVSVRLPKAKKESGSA
jgi:hypothetical protein